MWKQLSLVNDKKIIAVGANSEKGLKNWSELSKLFNQVTDVVFIDAFAFESELKEYNIIKIFHHSFFGFSYFSYRLVVFLFVFFYRPETV